MNTSIPSANTDNSNGMNIYKYNSNNTNDDTADSAYGSEASQKKPYMGTYQPYQMKPTSTPQSLPGSNANTAAAASPEYQPYNNPYRSASQNSQSSPSYRPSIMRPGPPPPSHLYPQGPVNSNSGTINPTPVGSNAQPFIGASQPSPNSNRNNHSYNGNKNAARAGGVGSGNHLQYTNLPNAWGAIAPHPEAAYYPTAVLNETGRDLQFTIWREGKR
jgi:hypothetical protein